MVGARAHVAGPTKHYVVWSSEMLYGGKCWEIYRFCKGNISAESKARHWPSSAFLIVFRIILMTQHWS